MSFKVRKAVIPAAGYGTRFLPVTKVVPKELLPIGNKPAIQYVVEEAVQCGIEEIVLICHREKLSLVDFFSHDPDLIAFLKRKGKDQEVKELLQIESLARFEVVYQEEPLGLGHAVWCARDVVGREPFLVLLPDVLVDSADTGTRQLVEVCQKENN